MNKPILTVVAMLCICSYSFSQNNLSLYGSFIKNLNPDYKTSTYGAGIRYEITNKPGFTKYIGFAYAMPASTTEQLEAQAFSSTTNPSYQNVTATYKKPMMRLEFGTNIYLVGNAINPEGINWYLNGGVEIIYEPNKPTYSSYDKENYTLGFTDGSDVNPDGSEKFSLHLFLSLGTGIEMHAGPGKVFIQGTIGLPATNLAGGDVSSGIEDFTPIPLNINIGYKIPLGSGNN